MTYDNKMMKRNNFNPIFKNFTYIDLPGSWVKNS